MVTRFEVLSSALALALVGCAGCSGDGSAAPSPPLAPSATSGSGGNDGGADAAEVLPCGGYAWGLDWPPADAPTHTPALLPPAFAKPDCGPGCKMVTTRLNFANGVPYEFHFEGRHFISETSKDLAAWANYVDLDSGEEYDALAGEPILGMVPGTTSDLQSWMGEETIAKAFSFYDDKIAMYYVCQFALNRKAQRLLAFNKGAADDARLIVAQFESQSRYVVLGGANEIFALDTADGSRHPIAHSMYYVTNMSIVPPYIVLPEVDAEVHVINMETWADENVTKHKALQYMAASDGKHVVWVDFRYLPPDNPTPEIALYNLADKTTTRITNHASGKWFPTVEGDWVAWMDDRDSVQPNAPQGTPLDRFDIYGYNLKTKKEYHLVGNSPGKVVKLYPTHPRLHRGKIYVVGTPGKDIPAQLFEFAMPEL